MSGARAPSVAYVRAPLLDSLDAVVSWLLARGCTQIVVHTGPDGSYRGCGRLSEPLTDGGER